MLFIFYFFFLSKKKAPKPKTAMPPIIKGIFDFFSVAVSVVGATSVVLVGCVVSAPFGVTNKVVVTPLGKFPLFTRSVKAPLPLSTIDCAELTNACLPCVTLL